MKLSHELAKIFEAEMQKVLDKEKADPNYKPQCDYETCKDRAADGVIAAIEPVINTLALSIAKHREEKHGDNTYDEQAELMGVMSADEVEVGTRGWWSQ